MARHIHHVYGSYPSCNKTSVKVGIGKNHDIPANIPGYKTRQGLSLSKDSTTAAFVDLIENSFNRLNYDFLDS